MRLILVLSILFAVVVIASGQAPPIGPNGCTVLPANSIWNTPVDQLPVSPSSSTYVNRIGGTTPLHADFGSGTYNGGPNRNPFRTGPGTPTGDNPAVPFLRGGD